LELNMSSHFKQLCATALLAITTLQAHAIGHLAELSVVDRTSGATLPVYFHRGEYWIAGKPGATYAISVCNKVGERLLAVMSVDGVNVLSGATAAWNQTGYVYSQHTCHEITGWRKSDSEVAAFEFAASSDSYAELTGRPNQVGVIGIALFRERIPEPVYVAPAYSSRDESASLNEPRAAKSQAAPTAAAPMAAQNGAGSTRSSMERGRGAESSDSTVASILPIQRLGTAHGAREASMVTHTQFERAQSRPNEVLRIRYDSREALVALGVIKSAPRRVPSPFPLSENASYVPDPPFQRD
jgi:hypothetical protein